MCIRDRVNPENVQVWNLAAKDIETYSANVQNALQDCDINNLIENTVEYTTRTAVSYTHLAMESADTMCFFIVKYLHAFV